MTRRVLAAAPRLGRARRGVAATLAALLCSSLAVAQAAATPGEPAPRPRDEPVGTSDVLMVQANIYTRLTVPKFQADVAKVLKLEPDFITYNEVPFRNDVIIAPPARYSLYRSMRNRFTAATPVAWRKDRWTAIDQGTFRVSNWRGKPPGRVVEIGRRFANWVTLRGVDGRVLSVVSVHIAPLSKGMPDLLRPSMRRIGKLVEKLAPRGPVLVGGDFNVHYKSGRFPRDLITPVSLAPTFDTLGSFFPTGDHFQATIDYVFHREPETLVPTLHYPVELHSDHDAVVVGLSWQVDAPGETTEVRSDPRGDKEARRAAVSAVTDAIAAAEPGATVDVVTAAVDLGAVATQLRRALARGVHVRLVTTTDEPSVRERRLARALAASGDLDSWARSCLADCRTAWRAAFPRALVLVTGPGGARQVRLDADRPLAAPLLERRSTVRVSTGRFALQEAADLVAGLPVAP